MNDWENFSTGKKILYNKFCAAVEENFRSKVEVYEREFKRMQEDYRNIVENVQRQFDTFTTLERIYLEREISVEEFDVNHRPKNFPRLPEFQNQAHRYSRQNFYLR